MSGIGGELLILQGPTGVTDQSGNGNNGTYQGGMGVVADTGFGGSLAFAFDGSNDFITLPTIAISKSLPFSVCAWIKTSTTGAILSDWNITATPGWMLDVRGGAFQYLQLGLYSAGGGSSYRAGGPTVVTDGNWHHAAATYDGTNGSGIKLYLDGVLEASSVISNTDPGTLTNGTGRVGARVSALLFSGRQDDIRIFNRAITAEEAAALATRRGYAIGGIPRLVNGGLINSGLINGGLVR